MYSDDASMKPMYGLHDGVCHKRSAGTRVSVLTRITDEMLASSLVPVQHASLAPPALSKVDMSMFWKL